MRINGEYERIAQPSKAGSFGGQRFLEMTVPKIRQVQQMIARVNPNCELELDGCIDPTTAPMNSGWSQRAGGWVLPSLIMPI